MSVSKKSTSSRRSSGWSPSCVIVSSSCPVQPWATGVTPAASDVSWMDMYLFTSAVRVAVLALPSAVSPFAVWNALRAATVLSSITPGELPS